MKSQQCSRPRPANPKRNQRIPMKIGQAMSAGLMILALFAGCGASVLMSPMASAAQKPTDLKAISRPAAGFTEILFHGTAGPFRVQVRSTLEASGPWSDMPDVLVTEVEPGV